VPKILLIRADASAKIGTGHVMRCIALGQAWKDAGGDVCFITCCAVEKVLTRLVDEGFEVYRIPESYPACADLKITIELIRRQRESSFWFVLDGYHFDVAYHKAIRSEEAKLLCVDDYKHLDKYDCDLLLNPNLGSESIDYSSLKAEKILGASYALIRKEFAMHLQKSDAGLDAISKILVTMGGGDAGNVSALVIRALNMLGISELRVRVLLGVANPHKKELLGLIRDLDVEVEIVDQTTDLVPLMEWADLSIVAASVTCLEMAAMRAPFFCIQTAENQIFLYNAFVAIASVGLGCSNDLDEIELSRRILEVLPLVNVNMRNLTEAVDAFGARRVAFKMLEMR